MLYAFQLKRLGPSTAGPEQVFEFLAALHALPNDQHAELGKAGLRRWWAWTLNLNLSGNDLNDIYLAALALERGLTSITADRGLARFISAGLKLEVLDSTAASSIRYPRGMTAPSRVQYRFLPARTLLCAVNRLRPAHLDNFVNGASLALPTVLTEQGLEQLGPVAIIYHSPVTEESDGPVEVCVPYHGELNVPDGLTQRTDPEHREAYLPLTKREFMDSALFHAAKREVEQAARANGDVLGPLRRMDYGVWATRGEYELVGELAVPMKWLNQLRPESRGRLFP